MSDLRNKLIRLAHENPDLRDDLLPLLKEARAVNPSATSWNNVFKSVDGSLHEAMRGLEDLSFTMDADWSAYLGQDAISPLRDGKLVYDDFLKTRKEVVTAIRGLNKVEAAWKELIKAIG